jgi:hypothetical protein
LGDKNRASCWPYAVLLAGVAGGARELEWLKWFREQRTTGDQDISEFIGLTFVPTAISYVAGNADDEALRDEAVDILIECSDPNAWNGDGQWRVHANGTGQREAAKSKLALACVDALGNTRSTRARPFLLEIQADPASSTVRKRYARDAMDRFDANVSEPTLKDYLIKTESAH